VKVTTAEASIAGETVSTTVDPDTLTPEGVSATPSTTMLNRLVAAVVADSVSENDSVTLVPAALVVAEVKVGDVESTWFVTDVADKVTASLPAAS